MAAQPPPGRNRPAQRSAEQGRQVIGVAGGVLQILDPALGRRVGGEVVLHGHEVRGVGVRADDEIGAALIERQGGQQRVREVDDVLAAPDRVGCLDDDVVAVRGVMRKDVVVAAIQSIGADTADEQVIACVAEKAVVPEQPDEQLRPGATMLAD